MTLNDTVIEEAGVMRCCLGTVALEYQDKPVKFGDVSECHHCKTRFVLVTPEAAKMVGTAYRKLTKPIWKPEWQLKKER